MTGSSVISQVVEKDRCIGCGVCVAVCPGDVLHMDLRDDGDLVAWRLRQRKDVSGHD